MALTQAHLARVARSVPEVAAPSRYAPLSDGDFAALAERLVADLAGGPLWLFAFGSLIWKPAFEPVESRRAIAHGWRRSFCIPVTSWRGTPEEPGLMMALTHGGACTGVAYRLPDDALHDQMLRLLRREIGTQKGASGIRWLTLRAAGDTLRALCFYCIAADDTDVVQQPLPDQARRIARAVGHLGSNAEYLHNTVRHLEDLGIRDRYLWRLQARVAAEIDALPGRP